MKKEMEKRATAQSGKNKKRKIEKIRVACVKLGGNVLDLMEEDGIDMRKEVTNHFAARFGDTGGD